MLTHEAGSDAYELAADEYRLMTLTHIKDRISLDEGFGLSWPDSLYIPSRADQQAWPWFGTANRYGLDWVNQSIGWLAVVAQVAINVTTTDSHGRHVNVTNGTFDTWGSLSGVVGEVWVDTKVYVP